MNKLPIIIKYSSYFGASAFKSRFILLFLFVIAIPQFAQVKFQNITLKQGLSSNRVYDCLKDSRGFIWFATDNGICRFDGTKFKSFTSDSKVDYGLKENNFAYIYQKSDDELLFISYFGNLISYSYKSGRFSSYSDTGAPLHGKNLNYFYRDKKKINWFATGNGVLKTDSAFNILTEYVIKDFEKGAQNNKVLTICEDKNGLMWLGMESRGVILFNPATGKFSKKELPKSFPKIQQVKSIITYPNSDFVFVATAGEGLFKININNFTCECWKSLTGNANSLPSDRVMVLFPQNDSLLWAGTIDGLALVNIKSKQITSYINNPLHPNSLVNNCIYNLYIDSQNILWVSTFGGISKFYLFPDRFMKEAHNAEEKSTLASNKVCQVINDKFGNLWIATSKGISIKDVSSGKYFQYVLPVSFPAHKNQEIDFFFIDGDTWWVGTWGGGLSRFKLPQNFKPGMPLRFKNFYYDSTDTKSLSSNFIKVVVKDKQGNLLITTWNGGMNKINYGDKEKDQIEFIHYFPAAGGSKKSVASNYTAEIILDADENMWITTSMGLQRLNLKKNESELIYADPKNPSDLINSAVCLIEDRNKNIFLGTFNGLVKIKKVNNKYETEIIFNNKYHGIYSMIEDKKGIIWFSTVTSEIGSYDPVRNTTKFYSMSEETDGFDFYFGLPLNGMDGRLYFPGLSGYLYFNPGALPENTHLPAIYFTSLKVNGEEVQLSGDVSNIKNLELNYEQRNLTVGFSALNYVYPEKNEYKYLLEGSGNEWVQLGNRGEINFANLKAGNYKLHIAGSNNDGVWNYSGPVLAITVNPPIWENPYMRIMGLLIIGFGIYWYFNRKIKLLKLEKVRQNKFSRLLIESQEKERKRLSGELHDSLGQNLLVIKNQLDFFKNSSEKEESDLDKISDLVKESITEVKGISSDLHPHQLDRLGLTKAIKGMINKIAESFNIEIKSDITDINGCVTKESEINIYRIIQESLNNIVKHSGSSKAFVAIYKKENNISIIIEDYGKGYDILHQDLPDKPGDGFGLKNIKERVRLINGKINIESAPGKGTRIVITLACINE